jgi:hypothetical protein
MNLHIDYILLVYLSTEQAGSGNLQPGSWITSIYHGRTGKACVPFQKLGLVSEPRMAT